MRTKEAPKKNGFGKAGHTGKDKAVAPKALPAQGAEGPWPGKIFSLNG
jgi:hypothetical protein